MRAGVIAVVLAMSACGPPPSSSLDSGADDASVGVVDAASSPGDGDAALQPTCDALAPAEPLGGSVIALSPASSDPDLDVLLYELAPDGGRVIFWGDLSIDGEINLYSVLIEGGPMAQLTFRNGATNPNYVHDWEISSDGERLVWAGTPDADNVRRLYSVSTAGGNTITLASDVVGAPKLAPNGSTVVYVAARGSGPALDLFSAPVTGGSTTPLTSGLNGARTVGKVEISPDGTRVGFLGDFEIPGVRRVYSVPIAGGAVVQVSGDDGGAALRSALDFEITGDGARVVYSGATDPGLPLRVYSAPIAGGAAINLATDSAPEDSVPSFRISPDGQWVVFAEFSDAYAAQLKSAPITGGSVTLLSPGMTVSTEPDSLVISPNSAHVVFSGREPEGVNRIYSNRIEGDALTRLSQNIYPHTELGTHYPRVTPDSQRVVFLGDPELDAVQRVYSTCISGGPVVTLSPNSSDDTQLGYYQYGLAIHPNSRYVFFLGDMIADEAYQLYRAHLDAAGAVVVDGNVSATPGRGIDNDFKLSPDGNWIVFQDSSLFTASRRLYSRRIQ